MAAGKFCANCGAATAPGGRFCGNCGARMGTPVGAGAGSATSPGAGGTATYTASPPPLAAPPMRPVPFAPAAPVTPAAPPAIAPAGTLTATVVGGGRYVVDHLLGRGGMSAVYAARDLRVAGRLVAIKEMVDVFADPEERAAAERDFAREAALLAALRHPAIPAIVDSFSENNRHLLVMEYIAGENLEGALERHGPYDEARVRAWARDLCAVLAYLHRQDPPVVFRDLKPGNIIAQPDGRVRLIDFGIARLFKPHQKADTTALGTSGYASPEHYTGQTDARSDVYSLGATLHHLLTGRDPSKFPPFKFPPVRELNPAVSPELAAIVERAVRADREKRFASIEDMAKALEGRKARKSKTPRAASSGTAPTPTPIAAPRAVPPFAAPPRPPTGTAGVQPIPAGAPLVPSTGTGATVGVRPAPTGAPPVVSSPAALPTLPAPMARPVLILEATTPGRRVDADAVAAIVAPSTGVDGAAVRALLRDGLPVALTLAPGLGIPMAAHARGLAPLGVRARVVTPRAIPVLLPGELRRRLDTTHQLVVRDTTVGATRACHCRRCGYDWRTTKAVGAPVPLRCPNCRSVEWGRWRIFKCAWCGHEFATDNVTAARARRLFPTCPCCGLANWETGRPARTGLLDRLLAAIVGTG